MDIQPMSGTESAQFQRINESFEPTVNKITQYRQGDNTYVRYGKVVELCYPLSETQECPDIEYVPQYGRREYPEMSSNAPFGVWIHRKNIWPMPLKEDNNALIKESLESKFGGDYDGRESDFDVIARFMNVENLESD